MKTTIRRRTTRCSSPSARGTSRQWWTVLTARAASWLCSGSGKASALAWMTGAAPGGRWAIIVADGSTASTSRSAGSYEPVPAPTFNTDRASPSASRISAASLGSGLRVAP